GSCPVRSPHIPTTPRCQRTPSPTLPRTDPSRKGILVECSVTLRYSNGVLLRFLTMPSTRRCQRCGAPVKGRRRQSVYCSIQCRTKAATEKRAEARPKPLSWGLDTCMGCGKEFEKKRLNHTCCSPKCRVRYCRSRLRW